MNQQVSVPVSVQQPGAQLKADIYETPGGEEYVLEIPVPGVKPEEIAIEATVGTVTVSTAPRPDADAGRKYMRREQSAPTLSRIFEFPMELDTDNVRAALDHGILRIRARKAVAGRPKQVGVSQAA